MSMNASRYWLGTLALVAVSPACGGIADGSSPNPSETNSVVESALSTHCHGYHGRPLQCDTLAASLQYPNTVFTSSASVATGELQLAGQDIPAHCVLTGKMYERVSPIDGQTYAIGFEMRLPLDWNRRFYYQGNGGMDGTVVPATGDTSGGGPLTSALLQGFAVISSDAGHNALQNPTFGIDPQARLDYGYQAVGKLTPMAKSVLRSAYGHKPVYSYIGGCSNGGRHAMVAASRYADQYDGYLVGSPGLDLPEAAVSSIYGAQQYAPLAGGAVIPEGPFAGLPDLSAAFNPAEAALLSAKVLERCDELDGVADGLVQDGVACQSAFDLERDVPTCSGPRDGTCLTAAQKVAIGNAFSGGTTSTGTPIYSSFPFDSGHASSGSQFWDFISPLILDSGAVAFIFGTPPADPFTFVPPLFALMGNIDQLDASIFATNATYTEASQSFMVPPDPSNLNGLRKHGGRMLVYHGMSDPIFSAEHTRAWFESLDRRRIAQKVARLYLVPGMNHCSGGPATDQFDLLTPLVRWVEQGEAPRQIIASARGPSNPGGFNFEVPPDWSPDRTRPLCPYPRVAEYRGGDVESAESFTCRR
jgi:pimeloyl-ACP methyl ester carboxylesterase